MSGRPGTERIGLFWPWQEMKKKGEMSGFPILRFVNCDILGKYACLVQCGFIGGDSEETL